MFLWTRLLVPSELDLDLKMGPKMRSKIDPKSIWTGILARNPLRSLFLKRLRRPQARFQGLREVVFLKLSSQTKKLSELLTSYYGRHRVDYKVGRLCHHCALLCAYLLGCFRSDKHIGVTNFNVDTSESFSSTLLVWVDWERIYDKFSVSSSIRLYSTSMLRIILPLTSRVHLDLCMYMHRRTLV